MGRVAELGSLGGIAHQHHERANTDGRHHPALPVLLRWRLFVGSRTHAIGCSCYACSDSLYPVRVSFFGVQHEGVSPEWRLDKEYLHFIEVCVCSSPPAYPVPKTAFASSQ